MKLFFFFLATTALLAPPGFAINPKEMKSVLRITPNRNLTDEAAASTAEGPPVPGKTMEECFQAALKRSELVGAQGELIKQAEATYRQAIGAVLPNVSGVGAYQFQQKAPANFSSLYPNPSTNTKLMVTQPLFQGFKEFAGLRQTKTLMHASEYDKRQATMQLYLDTATSYFAVASFEQDVDNVNDELGYYDKRINELSQFLRIGRSQVTDVLTAKVAQSTLRAQLQQIKGQLRAQRAVLAFLTGFDAETPVTRPSAMSIAARDLKSYLSRVEFRPDVKGDASRVAAAEEGIPVARAGHFPTVSLQGDYYLERTGALSGVDWDLLFNVTVPLFSGGAVQAQVAQAVSKRDQAEFQVSRTRRLAEQQIRQFYENYVGDKNQFDGYREAAELSEKNYHEEIRNYRLGLVTNLDVLTAITSFQENKRSFDKARFSMLMDIHDLEAAGAYKPDPETMKN